MFQAYVSLMKLMPSTFLPIPGSFRTQRLQINELTQRALSQVSEILQHYREIPDRVSAEREIASLLLAR